MSGSRPVLLAVDVTPEAVDLVARFAEHLGFDVFTSDSVAAALEWLRRHAADVAIVDVRVPDANGVSTVAAIGRACPDCRVLLTGASDAVGTPVDAVVCGALDAMPGAVDFERLEHHLVWVRNELDTRREMLVHDADLARRLERQGITGRSPEVRRLIDLVRRLAPHVRTALITGEPGTGKTLVARALHALGPRREGPFLTVPCATVNDAAFAGSHVQGSAAGPMAHAGTEPDLFLAPDGSTMFLDEVGDLAPDAQAALCALLDAMASGHPLNGRGVPDVQVLAATRRDLRADAAAGRFRPDLLSRLAAVTIDVPPLRQHREDIPYLAALCVQEQAARFGKAIEGITSPAEALLASAPWEGNVRELRSVIERATLVTETGFLTAREVSAAMPASHCASRTGPESCPPTVAVPADDDPASQLLSTVEREHILRALQRARGNKKAAARMLGVSRRALYRRLERLALGATITRRRGASRTPQEEVGA